MLTQLHCLLAMWWLYGWLGRQNQSTMSAESCEWQFDEVQKHLHLAWIAHRAGFDLGRVDKPFKQGRYAFLLSKKNGVQT